MQVAVRCPECRQSYLVPEERLNESVRCQLCGSTCTVVTSAYERSGPPDQPASRPPKRAEPPRRAVTLVEGDSEGAAGPELEGADEPMPEKLGRYAIRERLGGGGMGIVYLAHDGDLDRLVAVKAVRSGMGKSEEFRQRFLREARLAAKLQHPNVVTVYDVGVTENVLFLAMEHIDGGSLENAVAPGKPLPWPEATRAVRDAAEGLAAAHRLGLVHRDVKPANLLRTREGVTKVGDFGLARAEAAQTRLTQHGAWMGTPAYMSPEQWRGQPADARSDIYSLACTYYFLLTSQPPYEGESLPSLGYQHGHEPFPNPRQLVPGIPEGVFAVLARGSAKEPAARYADACELAADLSALLGQQGTAAAAAPVQAVARPSRSDAATRVEERPPVPRDVTLMEGERPASTPTIEDRAGPSATDWAGSSCRTLYHGFGRAVRWVDRRLANLAGKDNTLVHTFLRVLCLGVALLFLLALVRARPSRTIDGEPLATDRPAAPATPWNLPPDAPPPAMVPFSAEDARRHQDAWAEHLGQPREIDNSIAMKLVLIPPGEFIMGSPEPEKDRLSDEGPQHWVRITKPFYFGMYEVTEAEYERVMGTNPNSFKTVSDQDSSRFPVGNVSWEDAVEFCRKLSAIPMERSAGREYRLPTESEWEYACRAGTTTWFHFGNDLTSDQARFRQLFSAQPMPVGSYSGNGFGLYDMHGNVWEWCADWYGTDYYANSPTDDPKGPASGSYRVYRGGSWHHGAWYCRSASRCRIAREPRKSDLGFRVALVPADEIEANEVLHEKPQGAIQPSATVPRTAAISSWNLPSDAPPPAVATFSAKEARGHQDAWAQYLGQPAEVTNSVGIKLRLIPPGEFMMGSPESEQGRSDNEGPVHRIRITKPFYLGLYELRQGEWERVMGTNPSHFKARSWGQDTSRFPVENVSWNDAVEFCRKLSALPAERSVGREYRLPTEAEWEYACRAGTTTPFHFGSVLNGRQANHNGNYPYGNSGEGPYLERTTAVGSYSANGFGLFDMHGNVWEWCSDLYASDYYTNSPVDDPPGPGSGSIRVNRGGSWYDFAEDCRSANRYRYTPDYRFDDLGFRLALVPADESSK